MMSCIASRLRATCNLSGLLCCAIYVVLNGSKADDLKKIPCDIA